MKRFLMFFSCLAWFVSGTAQSTLCDFTRHSANYRVTAPSGLSLRADSYSDSKRIAVMPFGRTVSVCDTTELEYLPDTIEGVAGRWVQVVFEDFQGYAFSGFLERGGAEIKFVIPNAGMDTEGEQLRLPVAVQWWAMYLYSGEPEADDYTYYEMRPVTFLDTVRGMDGQLMARHNLAEPPFMFVSGLDFARKGFEWVTPGSKKALGVGMQLDFSQNTNIIRQIIYAKSEIGKPKDSWMPYGDFENYELRLRTFIVKDSSTYDQLIFARAWMPSITSNYYQFAIEFTGDLDGDGKLDILIRYCSGEGCNCMGYDLYLSSVADPGYHVKKVATFGDCGC